MKYVRRLFPKVCTKLLSTEAEALYCIQLRQHCTHVGAFPISVKSRQLAAIANEPDLVASAAMLREKIMLGRTGRLFVSVERFDYTKGIEERLRAFQSYFRAHKERARDDVFYQIAAGTRAEVSAYRKYQVLWNERGAPLICVVGPLPRARDGGE